MTNLYCDGDSWSVRNNGVGKVMGWYLSNLMGYNMENYGHSGKSVDKVIRSVQRHVLSNSDTAYMIGIGQTARFDMSTGEVVQMKYPFLYMESERGIESLRSDVLSNTNRAFAEQFIKLFEYPFLEYQTLSKLVSLHDFLKYHKVDFIIHNLGFDYDYDPEYEFGKQWLAEVEKRPRIVNFFKDSFHSIMQKENFVPFNYNLYQWNGHQEGPGHKYYAEYLHEKWQSIRD